MRNKNTFMYVFSAMMAALAVVLEKFVSIEIFVVIKLTFYGLPIMLVGVIYGVKWGFLTGFVTGCVTQITSKYGISIMSPFYALAPIGWGLVSGLLSKFLKSKEEVSIPRIVIIVAASSLTANLLNTFAFFLDTLLAKNSYYTVVGILQNWPPRLLSMTVMIIPYTILLSLIYKALTDLIQKQEE